MNFSLILVITVIIMLIASLIWWTMMSKDKCEYIRSKHPEWFPMAYGRWSTLSMKDLGIINDDYTELTADATESNLYDAGYLWMCALSNSKENKRELHPADWTYGQDGNPFLGQPDQSNAAEVSQYTALAKAFNRGYVDAQTDRNL